MTRFVLKVDFIQKIVEGLTRLVEETLYIDTYEMLLKAPRMSKKVHNVTYSCHSAFSCLGVKLLRTQIINLLTGRVNFLFKESLKTFM